MNINPLVWYSMRELAQSPPHFVKCTTPLTDTSLIWVITKLQGRFSKNQKDDFVLLVFPTHEISFEDPVEAMLYELRWSGTK